MAHLRQIDPEYEELLIISSQNNIWFSPAECDRLFNYRLAVDAQFYNDNPALHINASAYAQILGTR